MNSLSSLLPPVQQARYAIGDPLPELEWTSHGNEPVSLYTDSNCGRPTLLFMCRSAAAAATELAVLRDSHEDFRALDAQIFLITGENVETNAATASELGLPFPVLSDPSLSAALGFGLETPGGPQKQWCAAILNPNVRVEWVTDSAAGAGMAAMAALGHLRSRPVTASAGIIVSQPPVLTIPNVLEPELCARLIACFDRGERYTGGLTTVSDGDYIVNRDVKIREDVGIPDTDAEGSQIYDNFRRRVFPEIFKAFRYRVTRAESMRVGCYDSNNGGKFAPHRDDNVPNMRHRRFGFTINLNTNDYEGGCLRFPEYGPQLYAPATGSMVIFSVSLLHEAMPVTSGKRYGLFGFLFGETEEARRKEQNPSFETTVVDEPGGSHHVGRGTA